MGELAEMIVPVRLRNLVFFLMFRTFWGEKPHGQWEA
jgi:hypothetical protein